MCTALVVHCVRCALCQICIVVAAPCGSCTLWWLRSAGAQHCLDAQEAVQGPIVVQLWSLTEVSVGTGRFPSGSQEPCYECISVFLFPLCSLFPKQSTVAMPFCSALSLYEQKTPHFAPHSSIGKHIPVGFGLSLLGYSLLLLLREGDLSMACCCRMERSNTSHGRFTSIPRE